MEAHQRQVTRQHQPNRPRVHGAQVRIAGQPVAQVLRLQQVGDAGQCMADVLLGKPSITRRRLLLSRRSKRSCSSAVHPQRERSVTSPFPGREHPAQLLQRRGQGGGRSNLRGCGRVPGHIFAVAKGPQSRPRAMAITITDECINCGACEPECPNNAIYEGGGSGAFRRHLAARHAAHTHGQ